MDSNTIIAGFELSANQKQLWKFHANINRYYNQFSINISGLLDKDRLIRTIHNIIKRHEVLSSKCIIDSNSIFPLQRSFEKAGFDFFESKPDQQDIDKINAQVNACFDYPYQPNINKPVRFCLVSTSARNHWLFVRIYSLWSDSYSCTLFYKELCEEYGNAETLPFESERIEYRNFSKWRNDLVNEPDDDCLEFWKKYNFSIHQNIIPFANNKPFNFAPGKREVCFLKDAFYQKFKNSCSSVNCNVADLLLSLFALYLSRFTENELTIGFIPFKRSYDELNNTLGLVSAALPVKFDRKDIGSIHDTVHYLKNIVNDVVLWSDSFYLNSVSDSSGLFFPYCFECIDLTNYKIAGKQDLSFALSQFYSVTDPFLIKLFCTDYGDGLRLELFYDKNKFNETDIDVIVAQLQAQYLSAIDLENGIFSLSNKEEHLLLAVNDTGCEFDDQKTILDLFEDQVMRSPDKIAVIYGDHSITYRQLNEQSNQLARYLQDKYTIQSGDLIGVLLERSQWMVCALLGIMKAGAAYVPIDADYPVNRKMMILEDSEAKLLICDEEHLASFLNQGDIDIVCINDKQIYEFSGEPVLREGIMAQQLAYVIYTSGSTGMPKGCLITHKNLLNYIQWANEYYFHDSDLGNWGLITSISFDLTVTSLYTALTRGKKLYVGSSKKDITALLEECFNSPHIDTLKLTPSHLVLLNEIDIHETNVSILICGGEQLMTEQLHAVWGIKKDIRIFNEFGPTETTVGSIIKEVSRSDEKITIGKPIYNTNVNILDEAGARVGVGVVGEIYIGGAGVALGYLKRPDLTYEKFLPDPSKEGGRVYRTGDLGRWLPGGDIEYLGRRDQQVKIRGRRIEPGEIEVALQNHPGISTCAVVAKTKIDQEKELVAYMVSRDLTDIAAIQQYLKKELPDYMVPAHFVFLQSLPLTPNGKVNRKLLQEMPSIPFGRKTEYIAPRNAIEKQLALIWQQTLGVEEVGVKDNFYNLGGHSLKATRLASLIHKTFEVKIALKDLLTKIVLEDQAQLIAKTQKSAFVSIEPLAIQPHYQLSSSQRRLWVLSQFEGVNIAYNVPAVYEFTGELDFIALEQSFNDLINRHEVLRTTFKEVENSELRQFVKSPASTPFKITYRDFRQDKEQKATVKKIVQDMFVEPFDLSNTPLFRVGLFQVSDDKWIFVCVMHHIICDAWSMVIFINELFLFYNAYVSGKPLSLTPLGIHYKDYAAWQQKQVSNEFLKTHKYFWLEQFTGELPVLELPGDRVRPAVQTYSGATVHRVIDKELTNGLKKVGQDHGSSLFMSILALVKTLLYKYTGQQDIIVGTPIAGREHIDLENQIGFYVNTLALRTRFSATDTYIELLENIRQITVEAYDHQLYPFDDLVDALGLQRDISRNPLFDVMVTLQNAGDLELQGKNLGELKINRYKEINETVSKFDLTFFFFEAGENLQASIGYNSDIYNSTTIDQLADHLVKLLGAILQDPAIPIAQLDFLDIKEKQRLLIDFNKTEFQFKNDSTIVEVFEAQVKKTPLSRALVFENTELTFEHLNEKANRLGDYLRKKCQIQPDDLIGIQLERNEWMFVAIWGVLKSGAGYVPIDMDYPTERVEYILKDSNCKLLIDSVELEEFKRNEEVYSKENLVHINQADNLAYVIYTSGSTGNPKGVMIEHRNVVALAQNFSSRFLLNPDLVLGAPTRYTFDMCISELLGAPLNGITIFLIAETDPLSILTNIVEGKINALQLTPSRLGQLLETDPDGLKLGKLKTILVGGEALSQNNFDCLKKLTKTKVLNVYGPTETTVWSSSLEIHPGTSLSIGKPLLNESIYITDKQGNLCPIGVVGEICIAGAGVARGYLNRADLTAEKFIPNPFKPGERMYRTGDIGRWLPDGNIGFIGRRDDQVKIRGYRIELGEIESALLNHADIESCVVVAKANAKTENELVSYIISHVPLNTTALRSYLGKLLPVYMIPSHFVELESLPLNANGKIDRKRLPDPQSAGMSTGVTYIAPRNATEEKLLSLWQEILGKEQAGVQDNFFESGGHSLKATRLVSRIHKDFDVKIPLNDLFTNATIEQQAALIGRLKKTAFKHIPLAEKQDDYPLSASQQRLWLMDKMGIDRSSYNIYGTYDLEPKIDKTIFKKAIEKLLDRHETLRTIFIEKNGMPRQQVLQTSGLDPEIGFISYTANAVTEDVRKAVFNYEFDLSVWPLFRLCFVKEGEQDRLLYSMHHIISDGWSMELFVRDVLSLYESELTGEPNKMPALRVQYKDYANWQERLQEEGNDQHETFWIDHLGGTLPDMSLPYDFEQFGNELSNSASRYDVHIDTELQQAINRYLRQHQVSLFSFLISCFTIVVNRLTAEEDIIIGTPVANRDHDDIRDLIGFFLNTLMLRNHIEMNEAFDVLLQRVNTSLVKGLAHQSYPFEKLLECLQIKRDNNRFPISSIFLNMLNFNSTQQQILAAPGRRHGNIAGFAKFDLECYFKEYGNGILINCTYRSELFRPQTIEYWMNEYASVIRQVIERPGIEVAEIKIFDKAPFTSPVCSPSNPFNYFREEDVEQSIVSRFEQTVKLYSDHVAISEPDRSMSYHELNGLANGLGRQIIKAKGDVAGAHIGLLLNHGSRSIVGMLGVLKAGAVYVPMDPGYPLERLRYIQEDTDCLLLIAEPSTMELARQLTKDRDWVAIIDISQVIGAQEENLGITISPDSRAYILYTSGSTGQAKGVIQHHRNVLHFMRVYTNNLHICEQDKVGWTATYSFDASVSDIYSTLFNGAALYPYDIKKNGIGNMASWLQSNSITIIHLVPTIYRYFIDGLNGDTFEHMRLVILGGESVYKSDYHKFKQHFSSQGFLVNTYGPTESSTVLQKIIDFNSSIASLRVPVGMPVQATQVYILNENGRQAGMYQVGEIVYKSNYLSPGYLNKEELTSSVFTTDPIAGEGRVYRSGDFGRRLPNGEIEFMGRRDGQVKINGQRIELLEIEQSILKIQGVHEVAVLIKLFRKKENLIAYVRADAAITEFVIQQQLSETLPSYMVPRIYLFLDKFPLTPTGKISRLELPVPTESDIKSTEYVKPRNEIEEKLVGMWTELLRKEKIGVIDNFLELGINSLTFLRALFRIRSEFEVDFKIEEVFVYTTIESLAKEIIRRKWATDDSNLETEETITITI